VAMVVGFVINQLIVRVRYDMVLVVQYSSTDLDDAHAHAGISQGKPSAEFSHPSSP
jgi:hypothetical protein